MNKSIFTLPAFLLWLGIVRWVTKARSIQPSLIGARWVGIRHPLYYYISVFLLLSTLHADAINQVKPIDILELIADLEKPGNSQEPEILWLRCEKDTLDISFIAVYISYADPYGSDYIYIDWSILISHDLITNLNTQLDLGAAGGKQYWNEKVNDLVHDASSVTVNGQQIFLENAYMSRWTWDPGSGLIEDETLSKACLSSNQNYILGITHYSSTQDYRPLGDGDTWRMWEARTGKELSDLETPMMKWYYELYFSPQGNYALVRFFQNASVDYIDLEQGKDSHGYPLKTILAPRVLLVDLNQPKKFVTNRDVAFTQDEQFFVTERDGIPTLVHTATDTDMLHYSIPSPMVSAAFSPDGKRVYIAAANSKIYVFDSRLDSLVADWELLADPQR